jgi:integrase
MPVRKYLTTDEAEEVVVRTSDPTDKLLLQVGLSMGCRVSEVLSIRLHSIKGQLIDIWDEKKDEPRTCVVDVDTAEAIKMYLQEHYKSLPSVRKEFRCLFNFSAKTVNRKVKRAFSRAEVPDVVPYRWHTLRHTYIRRLLDALEDRGIQFVCLQTGDTPETILGYYALPTVEDRLEVANQVLIYGRTEH